MLRRLIQVSRAAPALGQAGLYGIVRAAHRHNPAREVTGALVFLDGYFAQLLEGPPAALAELSTRLGCDARHGALQTRIVEPALVRLFRDQALALRTRACLRPGMLEAFGYRPGFPVDAFPADVLTEFLIAACRAAPRAGGLDKRGLAR